MLNLAPVYGAIAAPFGAVGAVTRTTITRTSSMVFNRGRGGWAFVISRSRLDYKSEVGDPSTNSAVGAVVGWISRNFPDAPVRVIRESAPEERIGRSATGPGAMLRLLEKPNAWYSGVLQWMATIVDYIQDGNAYWLKIRNASGRVVELWWVPQRQMEPRWPADDPTVFISHYEYSVDGTVYKVHPKNVVHLRNGIDPENPRKGRSGLKSLLVEIFTDQEASLFTASLLRNLGVPGVVLAPANTTGGGLGKSLEADPEKIKTAFMSKFGGDNRGEPLVLTAPTDVKVLSWSPQDMNLRELRRIPEERISAVTGIPAGVAGLGAGLDRNTFTNYGEANKAAYTQAVIPLHRLIAAELEVQLLPEFGADPDLFDVLFDASVVAAMQEAAGEVEKRDQAAATKGLMKRSDYLVRRGQKPAEDGSDEVYIIPNNYVVVAARSSGADPSAPRILLGAPKQIGPGTSPTPAPAPAGEAIASLVGGEVRCSGCSKLLAEQSTPPYRFTCPKCKATTEASVPAVLVS